MRLRMAERLGVGMPVANGIIGAAGIARIAGGCARAPVARVGAETVQTCCDRFVGMWGEGGVLVGDVDPRQVRMVSSAGGAVAEVDSTLGTWWEALERGRSGSR